MIIIDPFVAAHQAPENDNNGLPRSPRSGADRRQGALRGHLVHHVRKTQPGAELTTEDMRGASALLAAVRSAGCSTACRRRSRQARHRQPGRSCASTPPPRRRT